MKLFVAVSHHATLFPHFLRHYASVGISRFFVAVDEVTEQAVRNLAVHFDLVVVTDLDTCESIEGGTAAVSQMRRRFTSPDEWVAIADLDEFQVHPSGVAATAQAAEAEGANVVRGRMIDRVATDGLLKPIGVDDDLWRMFAQRCLVTARLQEGLAYKCALVRGLLESGRNEDGLSLAHHHMTNERVASSEIEIHHFKWNAEVLARLQTAMARAKAAGQPFWVEYQRVLDHLRQHGRIRWEDFQEGDGIDLPPSR